VLKLRWLIWCSKKSFCAQNKSGDIPMQANKKFLVICISILITSGCSTLTPRDIDTLPPPAALPEKSEQGVVEIWYYNNITLSSVSGLDSLARYPDNPDEVLQLNRLEGPTNRGDRYAGLVRGYITAPADGQYRFFVNSDDDGQFLLSDSTSPSEARVIASVPGWTRRGEFTKYSSQTSGNITLSSGQRYYFEMRYREAGGGDQFAVAWEGPGFSQAVIDGQYLSSFSQGSQVYPDDAQSVAGYDLGYRVGFFDGKQAMPFAPAYPPLDNDQDRLYDNWEAFYGLDSTSPNDSNADNDNDILTNYDEFWVGSSPTNADSDGDGIPDGAEFAYGLNALDAADAQADFDNDGFSNLEEYEAGSDLTDSEDIPPQIASRTPGVWAQYFSGQNFEEFVLARVEPKLTFTWGAGSPAPEVRDNRFSARFLTLFTPPHKDGERDYQVIAKHDDGVRMSFDGQRIIDEWMYAIEPASAQITASAGQSYPVSIEFYENRGNANLSIQFIDTVTGTVLDASDIFTVLDLSDTVSQSVDTDNDGIPDTWEYQQGTNAYVDDSAVVNNDAGISNLEAFQTNVSPWTTEALDETISTPQPLPPITVPSQSSVTLTWTAPLTRVDGGSLSLGEIVDYELSYGQQPDSLDAKIYIPGPETLYTIENLDKGTWYFQMRTHDDNGLFSAPTDILEYIVK
jgi:hypothetical protein